MILEKIGFFQGYNTKAIRDSFGVSDSTYPTEKVLNYLKSGIELCTWLEYTECIFSCSKGNLGAVEYTDGEWVWPSELIHYVEQHGIDIPERFLRHVLSKKYVLSDSENLAELKSLGADSSEIEHRISYCNKEWTGWLASRCPGFDDVEITDYKSTDQYKKEAKNDGYELPDDW